MAPRSHHPDLEYTNHKLNTLFFLCEYVIYLYSSALLIILKSFPYIVFFAGGGGERLEQ